MPALIQVRSPQSSSPSQLRLGKGQTLIGRGQGCGLRLNDQGVSRDHGAFSYYIGVLVVEDHDSTNGIFVNGTKVKRQVLYTGDRVTVGPIEIYIQKGSAAPPPDAA
ncbi:MULTISPECIES: FHA domain-containing protein [Comamonas]|uniref:FHA domain-containing protein n=1 Tax=Comamonas squillarum TaxID=2977320 RepID=A0ABY6A2N4_9BURK|nr:MULTISPECIES: FHA domain-containing protein [Comamonas]PWB16060.1 hypothetical protein DCO45_18320 [Comamonas sp. JNW]UXC20443.1 FHA domain-containing protein [Comamonas sp. PR12]